MLIFTVLFSQTAANFTYDFSDSSVPPPFHRSYSITIESTSVKLVIDSYGDILLNETYLINSDQFLDFINKLRACGIKKKPENKEKHGCTGGTGDAFNLFFSEKEKVSGGIYHCGGKDYGNIKGNLSEAKDLFKLMVPDFGAKMGSTEK